MTSPNHQSRSEGYSWNEQGFTYLPDQQGVVVELDLSNITQIYVQSTKSEKIYIGDQATREEAASWTEGAQSVGRQTVYRVRSRFLHRRDESRDQQQVGVSASVPVPRSSSTGVWPATALSQSHVSQPSFFLPTGMLSGSSNTPVMGSVSLNGVSEGSLQTLQSQAWRSEQVPLGQRQRASVPLMQTQASHLESNMTATDYESSTGLQEGRRGDLRAFEAASLREHSLPQPDMVFSHHAKSRGMLRGAGNRSDPDEVLQKSSSCQIPIEVANCFSVSRCTERSQERKKPMSSLDQYPLNEQGQRQNSSNRYDGLSKESAVRVTEDEMTEPPRKSRRKHRGRRKRAKPTAATTSLTQDEEAVSHSRDQESTSQKRSHAATVAVALPTGEAAPTSTNKSRNANSGFKMSTVARGRPESIEQQQRHKSGILSRTCYKCRCRGHEAADCPHG